MAKGTFTSDKSSIPAVAATGTYADAIDATSYRGIAVSASSEGGTAVKATTKGVVAVDASCDFGTAVRATSINSIGVRVEGGSAAIIASCKSGHAMYASSDSGGVTSVSQSGVAGYFISGGAYAVAVRGALGVSGALVVDGPVYKYGGGFRIDHPLDPANKYLHHSFVESSEMKNIYDGVVTLDSNGEAELELPAWIEALNHDFRYQLTPLGAPAPNLHIARKVSDGRFAIAGGQPGLEVSWQLTGIRKDAWAQANPVELEKEKSLTEQVPHPYPELHDESTE